MEKFLIFLILTLSAIAFSSDIDEQITVYDKKKTLHLQIRLKV